MFMPYGVYSDGSHIYVAEYSNHRVLLFNTLPSSNAPAADFVLGQPNFISNTINNAGMNGISLSGPSQAHSCGDKFFVADTNNSRVLIWNSAPTSNGQTADYVLGQSNLTTNTQNSGGLSASSLNGPNSVFCDGTRLFVVDTQNHRVLIWNTVPTSNAQAADIVLGQPNMTSNNANNGGLSATTLFSPRMVFSDGTRLFVADYFNNRILVWNSMPTANGQAADFALGQPNLTSSTANNGGRSASTLSGPLGIFSDGTRLFIADQNNNRILIWNSMPTSSGIAADLAVGQINLTSGSSGTTTSTLSLPSSVSSDGTRLFVCDYFNNRVLVWNAIPSSSGQAASYVIGQPNFTSSTANNGGLSASRLSGPLGVFVDSTRVFTTDSTNNRILISPIPGI
jgi:hypothetical protein